MTCPWEAKSTIISLRFKWRQPAVLQKKKKVHYICLSQCLPCPLGCEHVWLSNGYLQWREILSSHLLRVFDALKSKENSFCMCEKAKIQKVTSILWLKGVHVKFSSSWGIHASKRKSSSETRHCWKKEGKKEKAEQLSLFWCVSSVSWRRGGLLCPQPFTAMPQCKAWWCVLENWRLGTRWSWGTRNIQIDETTRVPARVHGKIGGFFNGNRSVSGSSCVLPAALSVPTQEIFFTPMIVLNAKAIACGAKI